MKVEGKIRFIKEPTVDDLRMVHKCIEESNGLIPFEISKNYDGIVWDESVCSPSDIYNGLLVIQNIFAIIESEQNLNSNDAFQYFEDESDVAQIIGLDHPVKIHKKGYICPNCNFHFVPDEEDMV